MKKIIFISTLVVVCISLVVLSCKKENPTPVVKTLTLYDTKDASIFNGTNALNGNGVNGQFNDYGSGGSDLMRVGYSDDGYYLIRSALSFDVSSVPSNVKILSATLSLTLAKSGDKAPPVYVYKLTQDWTEGATREPSSDRCRWDTTFCSTPGVPITGSDVSWSHADYNTTTWTTTGGVFASTASDTVSNGGTPVFSSQGLIDDVKSWMASPTSNFGWLLKVDESALIGHGGEMIRYFAKEAATNGAPADTRPKLVIVYQQ